MFNQLEQINTRPKPFEWYTAAELWTDAHTSQRMLAFHLDGDVDMASRKAVFIDRSLAWITSHFHIGPHSTIADFGCGPGLYAIPLARTGADVTGIDFSQRSLQYARESAAPHHLTIQWVQQNYLDFDSDHRFDLILMIMCDFCALNPGQRHHLLETFQRLLVPGGSVLLDVYSMAAFERRRETAVYEADLLDGFWSPRPYYGFLNTFKYESEGVVLDKYTIVETTRTRVIYNWLQYFDPEGVEQELSACGLAVDALYADVAGAPYQPEGDEFAVVARKR